MERSLTWNMHRFHGKGSTKQKRFEVLKEYVCMRACIRVSEFRISDMLAHIILYS